MALEHRLTTAGLGRADRDGGDALRPIRGARLLDRHRLARRGDAEAGLSHLLEHLLFKGSARIRLAGDRPDLRRDGRRAERRHGQGDDLGLRAGDRPARARGLRCDGRHGVPAGAERRRLRTGGDPRGDRDVRGRSPGEGVRRARRGGVRRAPARPRDHRPRAGDRGHAGRRDRALSRLPLRAREHRDRRRGRDRSRQLRRAGRRAVPASGDAAGGPSDGAPPRGRGAPPVRAQGHRAVPRVPRWRRALPPRRSPLCAARAGHDLRRHVIIAAVPGGPRAPRPGLRGLLVHQRVPRLRSGRPVRRHPSREPRRGDGRRRNRARPAARGAGHRGRARARQGEPQGPRRARARVHRRPDEPARLRDPRRRAAALARRGGGADRRGRLDDLARPRGGAVGPRAALRARASAPTRRSSSRRWRDPPALGRGRG